VEVCLKEVQALVLNKVNPGVYLKLNMFRAFSRPSSGAQ
jgi:hypothetical protein